MSKVTMMKPSSVQALIDGPTKKIAACRTDLHLERIFIFESGLKDMITFSEWRAAFLSLNSIWNLGNTCQEFVEITIPCKAA
jgi:hypothetical protein